MLEFQGKMYARVSEIINPESPFLGWEGRKKEVLEAKAALGTKVHEVIKDLIDDEFPVIPSNAQGYVASFEKWRDYLKPAFSESEKRYYCGKKMITGAIDALVKLEGEEKCVLVDFKTSVQESSTWILQAHLYNYLLREGGKMVAPYFLFLKLDRGGVLPQVFEYKFDPNIQAKCMQMIESFWENVDNK